MTAVDVSGLRDLAEALAAEGSWEGLAEVMRAMTFKSSVTDYVAAFGPKTALRLLGVVDAVEQVVSVLDESVARANPAGPYMMGAQAGMRQAADRLRDVLAALR